MLTASLTVTVALVGLRFFGVLEWLELKTFDHLIQLRPDEGIDKRLLIVKITDDDIKAQDKRGEKGGSLPDPSLNRLLQILEQHKPRLIGIDLYRPFSADSNIPDFLKRLGQNNIIAVCKVPTIGEQGNPEKAEVVPPKEVSAENISFSDIVSDTDGTVRRHLMVQDWVPGAKCRTEESFSFMLAHRYLEQELGKNTDYQNPLTYGNNLQLGGVVFPQLQPFTGGYQDVDASGFQVLLNYRATSSGEVAKELTLEDIDKARALRQAMLETTKKYPNPSDWAAFIFIGEAE